MAMVEEQESLLKTFYANEKEPETKDATHEDNEADKGEGVLVAEGVPVLAPSVGITGPPSPWSTSLFACFGNNDEFFSSDLEVCVLGSCAPCLLYATNVERLHPATEDTFTNHFLSYSGLYCLGNLVFGCNALAPCFSCSYRADLRKKYNLMGSSECFAKSCGCGKCFAESANRECIETVGDFATHYLCHACALCQEGREIRRRTPHAGFFRSTPMNAPLQQFLVFALQELHLEQRALMEGFNVPNHDQSIDGRLPLHAYLSPQVHRHAVIYQSGRCDKNRTLTSAEAMALTI